ncbi:hypothetical protein QBC34DRAFT_414377 [Podospora aff. communis PSN243]|uniref:PH domain-containing protein n=1 Tax=Podospora aff. communis PSN243 TaxID=3040156 RepID=A0AAV9GBU4_9PEZI|nr:hypothetical protein QBC34DRAFT_414377 [Podospora aff. communis PSN243]
MELQIDESDKARRSDIAESRSILVQAHERISTIVKYEDLSASLTRLKLGVFSWKRPEIDHFGKLLMYDAEVGVLDIRTPFRPHSRYLMYTFQKILVFAEEVSQTQRPLPRVLGSSGEQLQLTGRIRLSSIQSIVASKYDQRLPKSERWSCLIVYKVGSDPEALEIKFATPAKRHKWAEELRAIIQTPRSGDHQPDESGDVSAMPLEYPEQWKETLLTRGFLSV